MSRANSPRNQEVLIVGGGPSGLIFALALLQNGISVRIIEKTLVPRIGQRGAGIMPRSLELFTSLGVIDDVMKNAILPRPARMYELPGGTKVLNEFEMAPITNPTPACPHLNILLLGQDRLENILHTALAKYSCQVEVGTELVSFEERENYVEVKIQKNGLDTNANTNAKVTEETAKFEWVIGADGARGVMRKKLGLSFLGESRNVENFVVGDIHVDGLSRDYWHMWGNVTTTMISLRPTEIPTLFNFVVAGQSVNHTKLSSDENALRQFMFENTGQRPDLTFKEVPWLSHYKPNIRMVNSFGRGRIYLAGDAAHVHSPTGGQGMNSGIQDSFNLAWKLALVQKKLAPRSLLNSYNEERLPVIAEMLNQTTKLLNKTFDGKFHEDTWNRAGGLLQLGVNYRWSSIVIDERKQAELAEDAEFADYNFGKDPSEVEPEDVDSYGALVDGVLRAGDRAPDSPGLVLLATTLKLSPKPCRLFEVFGPSHHTVLIFDQALDKSVAILEYLSLYPKGTIRSVVVTQEKTAPSSCMVADLVFEDGERHAHTIYALGEKWGIVVVRPDGVIGGILNGIDGLVRYFVGIFGEKRSFQR